MLSRGSAGTDASSVNEGCVPNNMCPNDACPTNIKCDSNAKCSPNDKCYPNKNCPCDIEDNSQCPPPHSNDMCIE